MKNKFSVMLLTAFVPVAVMAQGSLDEEINAELDRMYQNQLRSQTQSAKPSAGPAVQVNVQAQPQVTSLQSTNQGTNTTQDQFQSQAQAQKQPTTLIEASPLVESRADKMRKTRQDAEVSTEQTIVEKLEESRLEDEKRRAEVLFGDKFNSLSNQNNAQAVAPAAAPVIQQAPVVPVPIVVQEQVIAVPAAPKVAEDKLDSESIRGELNAVLTEFKKEDVKPKPKTYFGLMTGAGDYPDAVNVKGEYSLGLSLGRKFDDHLVGEMSFLYTNFQVEQPPQYGNGACIPNYLSGGCDYYPRITELNQYATAGLVKYQFLSGSLRPEVGALMSYTYRTFSDKQFALTDAVLTSHAIDLGLMLGASIELSESFSLGLDYRYLWNITNKVSGNSLQKSSIYQNSSNSTPIEELSYYNLSIVGRATF
jgi:hypothetical protein